MVSNLPEGTWYAIYKIDNKNVWDEYIKTGKVRGFQLRVTSLTTQCLNVVLLKVKNVFVVNLNLDYVMVVIITSNGYLR
jgi:hypothetical protein